MGFSGWVRKLHPGLFGLLIFMAIVDGSIATWLTVRFHQHHNALSSAVLTRTHFLVFVSWWTVLFSAIYTLLFLHSASTGSIATSVLSHTVFLGLTWIFWTAGAAAITAALGGGNNCSKIEDEIVYCNQLNALEGFAWASWLLTTAILVLVLVRGAASMRRGDGMRGQLVA